MTNRKPIRISLLPVAVLGLCLMAFPQCQREFHYDRIIIDPSSVLIGTGDTLTLNVRFFSGKQEEVEWYSDNEEVLTVNGGVINGISTGSATILARTVKSGLLATCDVTVRKKEEMVSGVSLSQHELHLYLGEDYTLEATVLPETAVNKKVKWTSSKSIVAYVYSTGYLYTLSEGTTLITVKTEESGFTDTCLVTVLPPYVSVESVDIQDFLNIPLGESVQVPVTVLPEDATNPAVTWESFNESVLTITPEGLATGVSIGDTYIMVTTVEGKKTDICKVSVY